MYLLLMIFGLGVAYFAFLFLLSWFFQKSSPKIDSSSLSAFIGIVVFFLITFMASASIPDPQLSNRVQHALAGGFVALFIFFLAVKNLKLKITEFQFFTLGFLIATALGVANEIIEFFLQNYAGLAFAQTINDTWLDLLSNTAGALVGAAIFTFFYKNARS